MGKKHCINLLRLPFLPLWAAPLLLFLPIILRGQAFFWGTPYLQFFAWWDLAWDTLRMGQWPLWNSLSGMGTPLLANYQTALFYPPIWLLFLAHWLGGTALMAWVTTLVIALHLAWAGVGMALLVRRLGLKPLAQAVSGLAFGLSGYLVARIGFFSITLAAAWLPWVIYTACKVACPMTQPEGEGKGSLFWQVLPLALCLGLQLLSGHAQTTYYTILLLGAWVAVWGFRSGGWRFMVVALSKTALAGLLACALAAVQLLPTAEFLLQSQRSGEVGLDFALNYSFLPPRILTLLAPNLLGNPAYGNYLTHADNYWEDAIYLGLLPALMAFGVITQIFRRKKSHCEADHYDWSLIRPLVIFLSILTLVSFVLALGRYTPVFPFLYRYIPTFDMFQAPTRFTLWMEFGLALLAAVGIEHWRKPTEKGLQSVYRAIAVCLAVMIGGGAALLMGDPSMSVLGTATLAAGFLALVASLLSVAAPANEVITTASRKWRWAVIAFLVVDLLAADWGLNPGIGLDFYASPSATEGTLQAELRSHRLYMPVETEDELKFHRFFDFNSFLIDEDWHHLRDVLIPNSNLYAGISSANNFDPLVPARFARWRDYLNGASEAQRQLLYPWMNVKLVEKVGEISPTGVTFEAVETADRARWFACAQIVQGEQAAWDAAVRGEGLVLEGDTAERRGECVGAGQVEIIRSISTRVTMQVDTETDGWLFLADTWYPGWNAIVDGKETPILRANYLFRAVAVGAGHHVVDFVYQPVSFRIGMIVTLLAIIAITIGLTIGHKSKTAL